MQLRQKWTAVDVDGVCGGRQRQMGWPWPWTRIDGDVDCDSGVDYNGGNGRRQIQPQKLE